MESRLTFIGFCLFCIATIYATETIGESIQRYRMWEDYERSREQIERMMPEAKTAQKKRREREKEWIASLFNKYYIADWKHRERFRVSRPEFFLTPFITRYREEVR